MARLGWSIHSSGSKLQRRTCRNCQERDAGLGANSEKPSARDRSGSQQLELSCQHTQVPWPEFFGDFITGDIRSMIGDEEVELRASQCGHLSAYMGTHQV